MSIENQRLRSQAVRADVLATALPHITAEMHRINGLLHAGHRHAAIEQFFALATLAIQTQRADFACKGYVIPGRTTEISVCRIPAQSRPGKPVVLFLPGLLSVLPMAAVRALAFADLFDVVICELPGHGASGQVADVSLEAFADEYAVVIDIALTQATGLTVIGESLGGLIALALARLRPAQIRNVILVDTPFHLTRPDAAASIGESWRALGRRPYARRVCLGIMGFDPTDGRVERTTLHYDMVRNAPFGCVHIIGGEQPPSGTASVVRDADIAALLAVNPALLLTPRISGTGHAVLLHNPEGASTALEKFIVAGASGR
jgi:pimeloyl-ACP methyl ester carboxylesterase